MADKREASRKGKEMEFIYFVIAGVVVGIVGGFISLVHKEVTASKAKKRIRSGGYRTPYEYEEYVGSLLAYKGYKNVQVTPKSGDYGADIICKDKKGNKYAVQCKMYSKPVGYKAVEEVLGAMHYYNCNKAIVVTNSTYTKQAVEAADKVGVVLWKNIG